MFSKNQLIRNRGSLILKGTATIVFGLVALAHPGEDIQRMMLPFGILVLLNGLIGVCRSFSLLDPRLPINKLLLTKGCSESLIGLGAICFLNAAVGFFLVLISLWLILTGLWQVARSKALKSISDTYAITRLSGWLEVVFGILLLFNIRLQWFDPEYELSIFAMVMGSIMIYTYFRIRSLKGYLGHHPKKITNQKNSVYYDRAY